MGHHRPNQSQDFIRHDPGVQKNTCSMDSCCVFSRICPRQFPISVCYYDKERIANFSLWVWLQGVTRNELEGSLRREQLKQFLMSCMTSMSATVHTLLDVSDISRYMRPNIQNPHCVVDASFLQGVPPMLYRVLGTVRLVSVNRPSCTVRHHLEVNILIESSYHLFRRDCHYRLFGL